MQLAYFPKKGGAIKLLIRQERERLGWTQEYVAKKCGVSKQTVCDWENSRRNPSYLVLVKLEDLFQMGHRELFGEIPPDKPDGNRA